jgi:hypothetical protein
MSRFKQGSNFMNKIFNKIFASFLLSTFLLMGCGVQTDIEQQTANHIGRPAFMVERYIDAGNFHLKAWERMHQRGQPATIYIEGDGFVQKTNKNPGTTPTPHNPVALHLASRDRAQNVGYISRPCQFIKNPTERGCAAKYWQKDRFAPEVIGAYENALNDIAARFDVNGFHLVGYDGGANIAAVLAASRRDVLSLRSVAGNLNPDFGLEKIGEEYLNPNAMLAVDFGTALSNVPQHHFIGAADRIILPGVYHSYRQMLGLSDCVHYSMVPDADHTYGWVDKWPELLAITPQCAKVHTDLPPLPRIDPENLYKEPRFSK